MKTYSLKIFTYVGLLLLGTQAQALVITPADCSVFGGSIGCEVGPATSENIINNLIISTYNVDQLYKQDVGGAETGPLAGSYTTSFPDLDPSSASIIYDGGDTASCPTCMLLVKDGNNRPGWFLFDLSSIWDGMETIMLENFWPDQGAISHVSIYGRDETTVPEPQMLALLGIGLIGVVFARRKTR